MVHIKDEEWVRHPDYPKHECSSKGRIRYKNTGRILKGHINQSGYLEVWLEHDRRRLAHRLICEAFYGPPLEGQTQVNHINSDRLDNRIKNLEWCTPQENILHAYKYGKLDPLIGLQRAVEVNKRPVRMVETGQIFDSLQDCANYLGVTRGNASRVITGERKGQRIKRYRIEHAIEEVI